jgi:hypothetical protein
LSFIELDTTYGLVLHRGSKAFLVSWTETVTFGARSEADGLQFVFGELSLLFLRYPVALPALRFDFPHDTSQGNMIDLCNKISFENVPSF